MTQINFGESRFECEPGETVLDTLLKANIQIPNSCRQGICQSCLMRSLDNPPPVSAQTGLKDTLQAQNYFLACICHPVQPMTVALADLPNRFLPARVVHKTALNSEIAQLIIQLDQPLDFFAGQFVNVQRLDTGLIRNYSIANVPRADNTLEFHVRKLPTGEFSGWVYDELKPGTNLQITLPQGFCHYLPGKPDQPLLLIGTGSGLAPLYGIIQDALRQNHTGPIYLYHGSSYLEGLYLIDTLREMEKTYANFHYIPCISRPAPEAEGFYNGRAHEVALQDHPNLQGWRLYLCGHPEMVNQTKKLAYLKGASLKDIYADAFYVAPP